MMDIIDFKIYFEDGEVLKVKRDTVSFSHELKKYNNGNKEWLVLNIGLVESEERLREEELKEDNGSYNSTLTFDELLYTYHLRISKEQIKLLEPFLREPIKIAKMFYREYEIYDTERIWVIYDYKEAKLETVGHNARYLPSDIIKDRTSYWWKLRAERYLGKYISNGAFIAGCILYGIPLYVYDCRQSPIVRFDKVIKKIPLKAVPIKQ
jgi:hypothetical protein